MKKLRIRAVLAVLLIAAIFLVAYGGIYTFFLPNLALENHAMGSGPIEVRAWPEGDAFHFGDRISYFIEVRYNPEAVEEIDRSSIGKNLVLEPFKIRSESEKEFSAGSRVRVYLRRYELQLTRGEPGKVYSFGPALLRYKLKGSGWFNKEIMLQPIPIGSRFPADAQLELKKIEGLAVNRNYWYVPWMFAGLAVFCGVWVIAEICRKIAKTRKERKDLRKKFEGIEDIFKSYRELPAKTGEPKTVLHQAHQILRALLSRKEGVDWLNPNLQSIRPEIRHRTIRFLDISCKAYGREFLAEAELEEALRELDKIFNFYVGKGEE